MRFKDLKLGQKLGIGFGLLISIAAILGILSIINMSRVSTKSTYLAEEYIAEVEIANRIERDARETMYNIRGYSYAEENKFLTDGRNKLNSLKNNLEEAKKLADQSTQLKVLNGAINKAQTAVNKYESLVNQTEILNKNLAQLRDDMNSAADEFISSCQEFLRSQDRKLDQNIAGGASAITLDERHSKITLINDIIDKGNLLRITNFKAQATRDPEVYENAIKNFDISKELAGIDKITRDAEDITSLNRVKQAADDYKTAMETFLKDWNKRETTITERETAGKNVLKEVETVAIAGIGQTVNVANEAVNLLNSSSAIMIIGLIIALILGIVLGIVLTRIIVGPIQKGVMFAQKIAEGDLTAQVDVDQKDEIGVLANALRDMADKLKNIISNIMEGADNIAAASLEMSTSSQEMSQGASEQASSAEEVSSSMEEMSANIQQNNDNAQETEKIAVKATDGVREGNQASIKSVSSMKEIAEKISIINDIAFQTNILALNAAVEAARAGEHGKGFAVVAAEVRKLAERSAVAAKEIDDVSKDGVEISESAGKMLAEIVPEIERTAQLVQEISAASVEQTSGAQQVNNAIQQLNQVTQQSAAIAEEMATSSEELSSQADQLKEIVSFFKVDTFATKKRSVNKKNNDIKNSVYKSVEKTKKDKSSGIKIDLNDKNSSDDEYEKF